MTKEEAISRIKDHMDVHMMYEPRAIKISEALNMAIKALEQPEPCEDVVRRPTLMQMYQQVCKGIRCVGCKFYVDDVSDCKLEKFIHQLPSVTPKEQLKIIHCKDCKWFNDSGCAIRIDDESDRPKEDDYCSFAERREDGQTN